MRKKVLSLLVVLTIVSNITIAQFTVQADIPTLVVNYDPSCMKKYVYETDDGYIVEDSYTNYHLPIDDDHTLILKVLKSEKTLSTLDTRHLLKLNCHSASAIGHSFVERVNHGNSIIYLIENKDTDSMIIYHVDHVIYQEMNTHNMRFFSPPYFSFVYDYDIEHFPGESLPADDVNPRKFDTRFYLYAEEYVENIRNDILLKMYYDVCFNREIGVTTELSPVGEINQYISSNPDIKIINPETGKMIFRSCQHPIHSEYLKGIGLYKETYYENGKAYTSQLTSIDGIPIKQYLQLASGNYSFDNYNDNVSLGETTKEIYAMKGLEANGNTAKGGEIPVGFDDNGNFTTSTMALGQVKNRATKLKVHLVTKGETLYSLSKKYNMPINEIKLLNELSDNTIYVNQHLMLKAK